MSKKTIISIIIILALILIVGISYYGYQKKQEKATEIEQSATTVEESASQPNIQPTTPKPSAEPKSDLMSDWKTYTNQTYGFKVKYPKDWQVKEEPLPVYPDTFTIALTFSGLSEQDKIFFNVRPKGDEGMIREALSIASEEKITVGGIEGSRITGVGHADDSPSETSVIVRKGDYLYYVWFLQPFTEEIVFNQMLSSFRFTK